MPWKSSDASRFSRSAGSSASLSKQWSDIANSALASGKDEGTAIKMASGVVKRRAKDVTAKAPSKGVK